MGNTKQVQVERGTWGNQIQFLLSVVGYAVGLGNIWRFPFLCYKNGGGAFLIPYAVLLVVAGAPAVYLEMYLGQFSSFGNSCLFGKMVPVLQGIGWAMIVMCSLKMLYYNLIVAWTLFYLGSSFTCNLPWSHCFNDWNTVYCHSKFDEERCDDEMPGSMFFNRTCWNASTVSFNNTYSPYSRISAAEEFFEIVVLNKSESVNDMGGLQWKLVVCLLVAWMCIFLCLIKGIKSVGKVVYFTATFPYLMLTILVIRGVTLEGAMDGLKFYIVPDLVRLGDVSVWKDAAIQLFYSLGPAFGTIITLSSYNKFNNNILRDAVALSIIDFFTSIFGGIAIFSMAGYVANFLGVKVKDVVKDGSGLIFIAYPEGLSRMPGSTVWAILFFFMLFTLGLDSMFAMVETVITAVTDRYPRQLLPHKTPVALAVCFVCFLLGLPMCLRGGVFIFTMLNDFAAGYCLILISLAEMICVVYVYGITNIINDIKLMYGVRKEDMKHRSFLRRIYETVMGPIGYYWRITWIVTTPIFLAVILIFNLMHKSRSKYGTYILPDSMQAIGWILSLLSVLCIPGFAIYQIVRNRLTGQPWRALISKTSEWCPQHVRCAPTLEPSPDRYANHTHHESGC